MNDIMIDLETLDTEPSAVILSIGACEFDRETGDIGRTFYKKVSMESCMKAGLTMSASTIKWWMEQSDEARKEAFSGSTHLKLALNKLNYWINPVAGWRKRMPSKKLIWANAPSFDMVIIRNAYRAVDLKCDLPHFRYERDVRTLKALYPSVKVSEVGTAHNALDDCIYQSKLVAALLAVFNHEIH